MSNRRFALSKFRRLSGSEPSAREIAHALNNVTAVIVSTVELLGRSTTSKLDRSLLNLLEHAAREVEDLSSRVVGLAVKSNPPTANTSSAAAPMTPSTPTAPTTQGVGAPESRPIRHLTIEELAQSLAARAMRVAGGRATAA